MGKWRETQEAYYGRSASSEENTGRVLPILFNTEMVQAILDGRKTVTRRAIKHPFEVRPNGFITKPRGNERLCPYTPPYQQGDILYVRETWSRIKDIPSWEKYFRENWKPITPTEYVYRADNIHVDGILPDITWHPSIHMPKEAARIWLKVTDVGVEQLQDITEQQAEAEGIHLDDCPAGYTWKPRTDIHNCYTNPVAAMAALWNRTLNKDQKEIFGWWANPWVWVIEFERCEKPEEVEYEKS